MSLTNGKMMRTRLAKLMVAVLALAPALFAQDDVVMKAMKDEMERSKTQLRLDGMEKPYYIEYRVDEADVTSIEATLGVLTSNTSNRSRTLNLQVRAGDYAFDNTNFLTVGGFGPRFGRSGQVRGLPLDDDYDQIRREIWLGTDQVYKQASGDVASKRSVLQTRKYTASLPDFTPQPPVSMVEPRKAFRFDRTAAERLARDVSAVFRGTPEILDSEVSIVVRDLYTRYLNSEGTVFTRSEPIFALHVRADARADDGLPVQDSFSVFSRYMENIKSEEVIARAKKLARGLVALRAAGIVDRYNGPVLFEGEAAGAVMADVFAPAIGAARFPLTDEPRFETAMNQLFGQSGGTPLTDKLGAGVMPAFLDVVDKPRLDSFEGVPLLGCRVIDDEGVPTKEVNIVEAGILKQVLATRTPTDEAKASTGSKWLFGAVPSNLFLTAKKSETNAALRQRLLELAKARGLEYGIVVKHASEGGLSWVARFAGSMATPGAPNASSVELYKLFADGREERIRGVEFTSLTPTSFKEIVAVGDKPTLYQGPHVPMMNAIFSGFGGAGLSGDILALGSFITPSILFADLSLKKANIPVPNPPVVPSPLPSFTQK